MSFPIRPLAVAFCALAFPAAALACPSYETPGAALSYTAESAHVPQAIPVIAGGTTDLATCPETQGAGYVIDQPDFTMAYDALDLGRALEIRVRAGCDAVLLVNASNGQWLFNDDANGTDPGLRIENAPSGRYDIWVGTYGMENCEAELQIETF
ncbi:hypothetical protein [Pararhodobacter sp.]|uniref:hypothetical protein n=1 Tax=Pararhodobacter sp. TaxID=2127056 RepID=UPI002AFF11BD|nr:hypothetical protein [Pararhodobacter sp.]